MATRRPNLMFVVVVMVVVLEATTTASPAADTLMAVQETGHNNHQERDGKFLSLQFLPFVTVRVRPSECTLNSTNETGTCTSTNQCTAQGGKAEGPCGNGYGVCCSYYTKCGQTVSRNSTFLVNDNYPSATSAIDNCQYTIEKMNANVCQLRLDLVTLQLLGPNNMSQCDQDTFTVVGSGGANPSVICGVNDGQHMYLDLASGTGYARINIATTTAGFNRSWKIKVTQIPCASTSRVPPNCLQYYTDYSGTINSFNYQTAGTGKKLANQLYTACIKTKEGFCGIRYTANNFTMSPPVTAAGQCSSDFLIIPTVAKNGTAGVSDRRCGTTFSDLTTFSEPFEIRVVTNGEDAPTDNNGGFSINYTQIPC
nr:uncharacterized protein LOC123770217 [Procambarus clarkii]